MKKGFTMIELIFVIVILGVLASVAIPRLAATRDDAEVAKAAANITTAVSDLAAYYTAKGKFSTTFSDMTNALDSSGVVKAGSETCATFKTPAATDTDIQITVSSTNKPCDTVWKMPGLVSMCKGTAGTAVTGTCNITVGGSAIDFTGSTN